MSIKPAVNPGKHRLPGFLVSGVLQYTQLQSILRLAPVIDALTIEQPHRPAPRAFELAGSAFDARCDQPVLGEPRPTPHPAFSDSTGCLTRLLVGSLPLAPDSGALQMDLKLDQASGFSWPVYAPMPFQLSAPVDETTIGMLDSTTDMAAQDELSLGDFPLKAFSASYMHCAQIYPGRKTRRRRTDRVESRQPLDARRPNVSRYAATHPAG